MLSCREATRLVSDALERPLGRWERLALRLHLLMCSACRRFDRQAALIRTAMRRLARREE